MGRHSSVDMTAVTGVMPAIPEPRTLPAVAAPIVMAPPVEADFADLDAELVDETPKLRIDGGDIAVSGIFAGLTAVTAFATNIMTTPLVTAIILGGLSTVGHLALARRILLRGAR